jgi:hypothetical protein
LRGEKRRCNLNPKIASLPPVNRNDLSVSLFYLLFSS